MQDEIEAGTIDWDDDEIEVQNLSGVEVDRRTIMNAVRNMPEVAAMNSWMNDIGPEGGGRLHGGVFDRNKYLAPTSTYEQFKVAAHAVADDDIVSNVLDTTESLAFDKIKFDSLDEDQEQLWNLMAKDWKLHYRMREMWAELFKFSQVVVASYWGKKDFKLKGRTPNGTKRKKEFKDVLYPIGITILDPLKVVPVGSFMFGMEKLVYVADPLEAIDIQDVLDGKKSDPIVSQIMLEPYQMSARELKQMQDSGYDSRNRTQGPVPISNTTFLLNPENVWRHTLTRAPYKKFADVRMKAVFELLDMKLQLRQRDRAHLIAATNFIVLIKKGTDAMPASPREIQYLQGYARTLAKRPLLVGDHRLEVEIVTPGNENVLDSSKHNVLNSQIAAHLYHSFVVGGDMGAKGDKSVDLARVVGKGLEARRNILAKAFSDEILERIVKANEDIFTEEVPDIVFQPNRIALDFDVQLATLIVQLLATRNLSRESALTELGFDQDTEARRLDREADVYDPIFQSINPNNQGLPGQPGETPGPAGTQPKKAATPADSKTAGAAGGGNNNGGGGAKNLGAGKAPAKAPKPKPGK